MKTLALTLLLAATLCAASTPDEEAAPMQIQMTPAQAAACDAEGGCLVISRRALLEVLRQACRPGFSI